MKKYLEAFLNNGKEYPLMYAVAASVYPILFYCANNFAMIYSNALFIDYCLISFCIVVAVFGLEFLFGKDFKYRKQMLTFLTIFIFLFLFQYNFFTDLLLTVNSIILLVSIAFAFFLSKFHKRIIIIQSILAMMALFNFTNIFVKSYLVSNDWMIQPDAIAKAVFKEKPNIYYIQPDGYPNFSELKKGYYHIDNNDFEHFLSENGFTYYHDFRSNYATTLSSNTSSLMMKHHYYLNNINLSEGFNDRNIIMSNNTVLDVFKNNGYKNYFISESWYLLLNRAKIGFDYSNLGNEDLPTTPGIFNHYDHIVADVVSPLEQTLKEQLDKPKFVFIEMLKPSHTFGRLSVAEEKENWITRLKEANKKLIEVVSLIKTHDPNALIMIMADHGGYIGLEEYSIHSFDKTDDRDKIFSIFSANLAIHWPGNIKPDYTKHLKTSVNVFRVLFSYLSKNENYLSHLQPNESYAILKDNKVYKCIDHKGKVILENNFEKK